MFHLGQGNFIPTKFKIEVKDGSAIGYKGLSVVFKKTDGDTSNFTYIEEAAADLAAARMEPKLPYLIYSTEYMNLNILICKIYQKKWISAEQLIKFQKESGLEDFCKQILSKNNINSNDIISVMMCFQKAYHGQPEEAFSDLEKYRSTK